jgi:hypothetical protein
MLTRILSLSILLIFLNCLVFGSNNIISISDAEGDENTEIANNAKALEPGELDILSLTATSKTNATIFEITFAKPVRVTDNRVISSSGMTLANYATNGFYTFNLDIYIDTDSIPGSGKTNGLPGRNVELGPQFGWEKAICLTPRPQYARLLLEAELENRAINELVSRTGNYRLTDMNQDRNRVKAEIQQSVYFPTLVSIHGAKVQFSVPDSFFHGKAKADWVYTAGVTASNIVAMINHSGSKTVSYASGFSDVLQLQSLFAHENLPVDKQRSAYLDLILQQK